jgi:DNA-binding PadR family transcriptional regulator
MPTEQLKEKILKYLSDNPRKSTYDISLALETKHLYGTLTEMELEGSIVSEFVTQSNGARPPYDRVYWIKPQ